MSRRGSRKGAVTAEELRAELEADPEWVAARRQEGCERQQRVAEYDRAAAPLKAELADAGFQVDSIADLYNQHMNYERAIPILLEWFPRIEDRNVKESVARALTVRWARAEAAPTMLAELKRQRDSEADRSLRFAAANALAEVADDSVFDEVVRLVQDRRYPIADRGRLVVALANMLKERDRAIKMLRSLLSEDVAPHAITALGELRAIETRAEIEPFLGHQEAWVRQEAEKALRKFDTADREGS